MSLSLHCSKEPLGGLTVVIVGRLSESQAALGKEVASQGGTVVAKISPKVDLCISKRGSLCLWSEEVYIDRNMVCLCVSVSLCFSRVQCST